MSFENKNIFACLPATERGKAVHLGADPKGKNLLYTNGRSVIIRDLDNPEICDQYTEHIKEATVARYSPSGFYIASGDIMGNVRVWDTVNKEHALKLETRALGGEIRDLQWDGESKRIVVAGNGSEKYAHAFFADSGTSCGEMTGHSKICQSCDLKSNRPFRAITASDDLSLNWYEGPPFKVKGTKKDHTRYINCCRFSPSGSHFVSVGADGKICIYDGKTGEKMSEIADAHKGGIFSCMWAPEGNKLLTSSADKTVKLWDIETQAATHTFAFADKIENQQVGCAYVGKHVISLSLNSEINYLDLANPQTPLKVLKGHVKPAMAVATKDKTIFTGDNSGRMNAWDSSNGVCDYTTGSSHTNQISGMTVDGDNVVSCGFDDSVRLTSVSTKVTDSNVAGTGSQARAIASRGGLSVVATLEGVSVLRNNKKVSSIKADAHSVAISIDGTEVAVGLDKAVQLYSLSQDTLSPTKKLEDKLQGKVSAISYSPDGNYIAVGDSSKYIIVYSAKDGSVAIPYWTYHLAKVTALSWSPDSLYCASSSLDTHVFVWSVKEPRKRIQIKGAHIGSANGVSYLDQNTIVSCGQDATVKVWTIKY